MIICPLCGNAQEQGDCEVCGEKLTPANAEPSTYPILAELEPTLYEEGFALVVERMEEIEDHCAQKVEAVSSPLPGLLAHTAGTQPVLSRPKPLKVTCRYCGQVQKKSARLCQGCARALPLWTADEASGAIFSATSIISCNNCGVPTPPGRCRDCGAVNPPPASEPV